MARKLRRNKARLEEQLRWLDDRLQIWTLTLLLSLDVFPARKGE